MWIKGIKGRYCLRPDGDRGAVITSDAPRETSALAGYESLDRRVYRLAAQTQPHSASRPRRRTWWLTGSAAKSGTQRISGKDTKITTHLVHDREINRR